MSDSVSITKALVSNFDHGAPAAGRNAAMLDALKNLEVYFTNVLSGSIKPPARFPERFMLSAKQPGKGLFAVADISGGADLVHLAGFELSGGVFGLGHAGAVPQLLKQSISVLVAVSTEGGGGGTTASTVAATPSAGPSPQSQPPSALSMMRAQAAAAWASEVMECVLLCMF